MRIILLTLFLSALGVFGAACSGASGGAANSPSGAAAGGDSPTEAYKRLFEAVKAKNTDAIKQSMSRQTQEFAVAVAQRQNTPIEKVFENGFTATTFSETLPQMRDERIEGNNGALEVWNSKESKWEDLPFIKEDSGWKLAIGDLFKDSWKSPGRGRAAKEMEAANAANGGAMQAPTSGGNTSSNTTPVQRIIPKAAPGNTTANTNGK